MATCTVHLRLMRKLVVNFLFVLIERFSLGVTVEALYELISIENWRFRSNRVSST